MHKSSPRFLGYFIPGNLYKKIVLNVLHDSGHYQSELRHLHNGSTGKISSAIKFMECGM